MIKYIALQYIEGDVCICRHDARFVLVFMPFHSLNFQFDEVFLQMNMINHRNDDNKKSRGK